MNNKIATQMPIADQYKNICKHKFDITKLIVQKVMLSSVTEVNGGSMKVVDPQNPKDGKIIRWAIPYAVARRFKKANKGPASFIVPVEAAVVKYDGTVMLIEKRGIIAEHLRGDREDATKDTWNPTCQHVIDRFLSPLVAGSTRWRTDGVHIYELPKYLREYVEKDADHLTASGVFRNVCVKSVNFADLSDSLLIEHPGTRSCVAIVTPTRVGLTPPIWKTLADFRQKGLKKDELELEETTSTLRFDSVAQHYDVNLEFALYAGKRVGAVFGYDAIEPLQLDELMHQLCTVNLPKIKKEVRQTTGIGVDFLTSFAWVAGLTMQCSTMQDFMQMRGVLKQLCTKGICRNDVLEDVYKAGVDEYVPEIRSKEEALKFAEDNMSTEQKREFWSTHLQSTDEEIETMMLVGNSDID